MKIIYNSKIAKIFLLKGYSAILLFFWLLCKRDASSYKEGFLKHERAHSSQWKNLSLFIGVPLWLINGFLFTWWLLLLIPFTFYLWYGLEWLIRFCSKLIKTPLTFKFGIKKWFQGLGMLNHEAYRDISFEQEARMAEKEWSVSVFSFLLFY